MNESVGNIVILVFYIVGYGGLVKSLYQLYVTAITKTWHKTKATILDSDIREEYTEDGTLYKLTVNYQYNYKGHNYQSNRIAIGYKSNNSQRIAKVLYQKFKKSKRVDVFINPRNPKLAVLVSGIRYFHLLKIGFYVIWLIFIYFIRSH